MKFTYDDREWRRKPLPHMIHSQDLIYQIRKKFIKFRLNSVFVFFAQSQFEMRDGKRKRAHCKLYGTFYTTRHKAPNIVFGVYSSSPMMLGSDKTVALMSMAVPEEYKQQKVPPLNW